MRAILLMLLLGFWTTDAGATWSAVNPRPLEVASLALDPSDSNTMYSGRSGGVYAFTFAEVEQ